MGYVEQQDIHSAATTVLEALWFRWAWGWRTCTVQPPLSAAEGGYKQRANSPHNSQRPPAPAALRAGRPRPRHVAEVLDTVKLSMVGNALVGDAPAADGGNGGGGAGLSVEQRKRLTIAVELVAQPRWAGLHR